MSGVTPLIDTLLATRLAQRVDLVPLKGQTDIAGPDAVTHIEKVTNDVRLPSRAALQQQLGVMRSGRGDSSNTAPSAGPGGTVTLSAVARAISAILDLTSGATPKILGSEPLWPHLQPPLAHLLTATLARTVASSGLFYESHLQQYAAGTRTLAQLAQEPQARLGAMEKMPLELPGTGVAGQDLEPSGTARMAEAPGMLPVAGAALLDAAAASSDAGAEPLLAVRPGAAGDAVTINSSEADAASASIPLPVGLAARLDPAPLAGTYGRAGVLGKEHAPVHDVAGQETLAKNPGASSLDAVGNNNPVAAAIHPDAIALVRQQLELLALPVFRWGGEVWPGTPMDWEIHEENERQAVADPEAAQRTWTTRLALTLPTLKTVEVRMTLAGTTLQVHLAARENATLALLSDGGNELTERFGAAGLQLSRLQIGALALEPAAQDIRKADDAA
jgi:hypothetical protein